MKKLFALFLLLVLFLPFHPAHAARKVVAANLTENFVGVSEGFGGAKLTVFGVLKRRADAVVVIEGPLADASVRAKTRQMGIWINGPSESMNSVPSFYAVVSSQPVDKIVNQSKAKQYGLDMRQLPFAESDRGMGYVAVKMAQGLYQYKPDGVKILESNLFRADIVLPASVPIGNFRAHIYEFVGGDLSAMRIETFNVAQVGMNAKINNMAHHSPILYAFLALCISFGIGGGAAYLSRRMA